MLLAALGRVEPLHFKFGRIFVRSEGGSGRRHAIAAMLAFPGSLVKHLVGEIHEPLLLFSNEGGRFALLLTAVLLPLHLAVILQLRLHVLSQVLQLVIPATFWVHIHLNIADLPALLQHPIDHRGELHGSAFACGLGEED